MPRASTGQVIERTGPTGTTRSIRFRAPDGRGGTKRTMISLGYVSEREADAKLADVLAAIRLGQYRDEEPEIREVPRFDEFAREWLDAKTSEGGRGGEGLTPRGVEDLEWRLGRLEAVFGDRRLDAITTEDVDRARLRWRRADGLSPRSTNMLLGALSAILRRGVDYEHIDRDPAAGRRLPSARPRRPYLDRSTAIAALLDAAGDLDRATKRSTPFRRPLLAVMTLGGLRIDEALSLRWADLDLHRPTRLGAGKLRVRGTKSDAADRDVDLLPALRESLLDWRAVGSNADRTALMFPTSTGRKLSASNVRTRVLAPAAEAANARLALDGMDPLTDGTDTLTPHGLRRTAASVFVALGLEPTYVMALMGHGDPKITLSLYAKAMSRDPAESGELRALVGFVGAPSAPLVVAAAQPLEDAA